jgi:sec-independent protein translocase protein TatA
MFGTLGTSEMIVIFLLALLLFGPKKLPEIGRTIGKAVTEFRRASNDLKSTFEREMKTLEQESDSFKEATSQYQYDPYNYDYSSYETPSSETSCQPATDDSASSNTSTESASAPQGAESTVVAAPEGTVARGTEAEAVTHETSVEVAVSDAPAEPSEPAHASSTTEQHKA